MSKEQGNKGFIERSAGFFEKPHYILGALAIAGALIAPAEFVAPLIIFGAYEVIHGGLLRMVKNRAAKKPQPAPA